MDEKTNNFRKICFANGLITYTDNVAKLLNITQKPTKLSKNDKEAYYLIEKAQLIVNKLFYFASKDTHKDINDPIYTNILNKILSIKPKKKIHALFLRTDYLFDCTKNKPCPIQVEINTISCAFLMQGPMLNRTHSLFYKKTLISDSDNKYIEFLSKLKTMYMKEYNPEKTDNLSIIMVDNDTSLKSSNILEKINIIKDAKEFGIDVFHLTYDEIRKNCTFIDEKNKKIDEKELTDCLENRKHFNQKYRMFYSNREVFCVYYRWYYNNEQYKPEDIILRAKIECSTVISVPNVEVQILGLKIFQMRFKDVDFLQKYLTIKDSQFLMQFFGEYHKYDKKIFEKEDIHDFVLKTLEEGGGNNFFGKDILNYKGNPNNVFLMKKIKCKSYDNAFILDDKNRKIIPEIGIMGYILGYGDFLIDNKNAGYICRSKDVESNECGVSCGYGALDSIIFDEE